MNKYIVEQLNNCKLANIPDFNESDTVLIIEGVKRKTEFKKGHYYSLELENYMINPPANFDIYTNWNNSTHPSTASMVGAEVVDEIGDKMIKVAGNCSDGVFWSGWVPKKAIKNAKELHA